MEDEIAPVQLDTGSTTGEGPATLIRRYKGAKQADAVAAFQLDAKELAKQGYAPTTQSWAEGQWGCWAFLAALLLCLLLVGILILIYMLLMMPAGTLTVTYTRNDAVVAPPATPAAAFASLVHGSFRERLARLNELRGSGVVTDEEYAAMRAKLLDEV
jgi:hypothetical protein